MWNIFQNLKNKGSKTLYLFLLLHPLNLYAQDGYGWTSILKRRALKSCYLIAICLSVKFVDFDLGAKESWRNKLDGDMFSSFFFVETIGCLWPYLWAKTFENYNTGIVKQLPMMLAK
jgi:hypothetical protein